MTVDTIDLPLLRLLRARDGGTAEATVRDYARCRGVYTRDGRLGLTATGVTGGHLGADIALATWIGWSSGWVRIRHGWAHLPATTTISLVGRPMVDLIGHDLLEGLRISRVEASGDFATIFCENHKIPIDGDASEMDDERRRAA